MRLPPLRHWVALGCGVLFALWAFVDWTNGVWNDGGRRSAGPLGEIFTTVTALVLIGDFVLSCWQATQPGGDHRKGFDAKNDVMYGFFDRKRVRRYTRR